MAKSSKKMKVFKIVVWIIVIFAVLVFLINSCAPEQVEEPIVEDIPEEPIVVLDLIVDCETNDDCTLEEECVDGECVPWIY